MADDNGGVVRITLKDVYTEVQGLRDDVKPLVSAVPDHETRLRRVEHWTYAIPPTFILAIAALVTEFAR